MNYEELLEENESLKAKVRDLEKKQNKEIAEELNLLRSKTDLQLKLLYEAINKAPVAISITDAKGRIIYVNPKFEDLTGFSEAEAKGNNPKIMKSGRHNQEFYQNLWKTITSGREWTGELINKHKNGQLYWTKDSISPIIDQSGEVVNFISVKNDITELVKAKQLAEESDRLKSSFLANISHELRTPLNAIIGFNQLINEKTSVKEIIDHQKRINESTENLLKMVESLLDSSIIQANEFKLNLESCSLAEIFSRLKYHLDIEYLRLKKNSVKLSFINDELLEKVKIRTDKIRLVQILSNLLNNGFKFTEQGEINYGYKIEGKNITFFVKDTGIGISEDKLPFIFDKFRQVEDTKSRKYQGLGLGLANCREIVNLMKGKLTVESKPEIGSTFFVFFENIVEEINQQKNKLIDPVKKDFPNLNLTGKTIMIAEDLEMNYLLLAKMISPTNSSIIRANDGLEAIELVKKNKNIDLILMDLMMPNMDGYQATEEIKKIFPKIPVVAQTAHTTESEINKAFAVGMDDYLTKPINRELLYKVISKYISEEK